MLKEQKTAQVTKIDAIDKQEKAPQLYSLTALQRDANRFLTEDMEYHAIKSKILREEYKKWKKEYQCIFKK